MKASAKRQRQVASFDEGELWCSDEADPPQNPAGWYFRMPGGSPQLWIGPFADAADATLAPFSGDALRDARRYLDAWRKGDAPPKPKLRIVAPPAPLPPRGQLEFELPGAGAAPDRPRRTSKRRPSGRLQLSLPLDPR